MTQRKEGKLFVFPWFFCSMSLAMLRMTCKSWKDCSSMVCLIWEKSTWSWRRRENWGARKGGIFWSLRWCWSWGFRSPPSRLLETPGCCVWSFSLLALVSSALGLECTRSPCCLLGTRSSPESLCLWSNSSLIFAFPRLTVYLINYFYFNLH
jgi:hypothetical protein